MPWLCGFVAVLVLVTVSGSGDEEAGRAWLEWYDTAAAQNYRQAALMSWAYNTNLTEENKQAYLAAKLASAEFDKAAGRNASQFEWWSFSDLQLRRMFRKISELGTAALPSDKVEQFNSIVSDMKEIYSTAEVCNHPTKPGDKCYSLNPDLYKVLTESRDYEELTWLWQGWREQTGRKMADKYEQYVDLLNQAASLNNHINAAASWQLKYESADFEELVSGLYEQVEPLYRHLHAYVRRKLLQIYPEEKFPASGHIPAHLLGNMWAQSWDEISSAFLPFANKSAVDVTDAMKEQGYTVRQMFEMSEDFFVSLGFEPLPDSFWEKSVLERPSDGTPMVCHASAWNLNGDRDFRIKQCTEITMSDLITVHHEMGHIYYYMEYRDQHILHRTGTNPGFHEAVGDVISLSVATPEHLNEVGLLDSVDNDQEADLNFLMSQALSKVAFLPFGLLVDQWRWSVFKGETAPEDYNRKWWELRCKMQGIYPPVARTADDFDPGSKYHVPADVPYIRYFVSHMLLFQMHDALCKAAGNTRPLHRCDIYQSQVAGQKLRDMLSLGASELWPDALEALTGSRNVNASAILTYFQPLLTWLEEQNRGHDLSWDVECPPGSFTGEEDNKGGSNTGAKLSPVGHLMAVLYMCSFMYLLARK